MALGQFQCWVFVAICFLFCSCCHAEPVEPQETTRKVLRRFIPPFGSPGTLGRRCSHGFPLGSSVLYVHGALEFPTTAGAAKDSRTNDFEGHNQTEASKSPNASPCNWPGHLNSFLLFPENDVVSITATVSSVLPNHALYPQLLLEDVTQSPEKTAPLCPMTNEIQRLSLLPTCLREALAPLGFASDHPITQHFP